MLGGTVVGIQKFCGKCQRNSLPIANTSPSWPKSTRSTSCNPVSKEQKCPFNWKSSLSISFKTLQHKAFCQSSPDGNTKICHSSILFAHFYRLLFLLEHEDVSKPNQKYTHCPERYIEITFALINMYAVYWDIAGLIQSVWSVLLQCKKLERSPWSLPGYRPALMSYRKEGTSQLTWKILLSSAGF